MSLTISQRNEALRHLGYPMMGSPQVQSAGPPYTATFGQAGGLLGFRYFEFYALLVYRLNNFSREEEVAVFGPGSSFFASYLTSAAAQINLTVTAAAAGDSIVAQINGAAALYTLLAGDTAALVATGLEQAINANPTISSTVVAQQVAGKVIVSARAPGFAANALSLQVFPQGASVTATVTQTDGVTVTPVLAGGQDPPGPVFTDPSQNVVMPYYGYLPIIRYWESQIPLAASGMDTIAAGPFTQRQDELAARTGGYILWCKRLAQWFGVPYRGAGSFDGSGPRRRVS